MLHEIILSVKLILKSFYKWRFFMSVAIVTDSNSGITQKQATEMGITLVPMPFLINGEEYFEDITLSTEQFYEKLLGGADVSTSQPSIFSVSEMWKELLKTHDEVLHIPMSSGLSASCETATAFAKEFEGKVVVVDNKRISITQKQAVHDAIKLAAEGKTAGQIKEFLEETSKLSGIYIMVTTLKYLKKGGRITPAAAAIGSLLKIKPVLQIQGAKLDKFCQGKKRMIDQIIKDITTRFADILASGHLQVSMAYTGDKNKCEEFRTEANTALAPYGLSVLDMDPLSLSVACHIGDGAIAIGATYKY
jgi:DegV family protein with EDD domain